jgi:hypothetical protein
MAGELLVDSFCILFCGCGGYFELSIASLFVSKVLWCAFALQKFRMVE